jgi:hypothetical protein
MTRLRERRDDQVSDQNRESSTGVPDAQNLRRLRREARNILAAGNDAINRALSRDSAAFLQANRQQGGQ